MVFSTAFGTAVIWELLIDFGYSIDFNCAFSSIYIAIVVLLLFFLEIKLNQYIYKN